MRSRGEYEKVLGLVANGLNDCQISRSTGIPRCTVRDWRRGHNVVRRSEPEASCPHCEQPAEHFDLTATKSYAYLLGLYLGDGHLSRAGRTW
jgi:hypothetical protein